MALVTLLITSVSAAPLVAKEEYPTFSMYVQVRIDRVPANRDANAVSISHERPLWRSANVCLEEADFFYNTS